MTQPEVTDQAFLQQADQCMAAILQQLDAFDPDDLEADLAMGVLKLAFADGRKCILNRQTAAHQIWLAEGATAWHFTRHPESGAWIDTKGRGDLHTILAAVISKKLGRSIQLRA